MQLGRTLVAVLLAVNMNSPEQLVAGEVYPFEVMHNGHWVTLRDEHWVALKERLAAKQPEDGWPVRISDAMFDLHVYRRTENAAPSVKKDLDTFLVHFVDDLTERYGLNPDQKQKLHLAGRGDIQRLIDRIEESRLMLQADGTHENDLAELNWKLRRDADIFRPEIKNPFGTGSLIVKTLNNTLTSDQIAAYEKWKLNSPVTVTRSWDNGTLTKAIRQTHVWILDHRGSGLDQ